MAPVTQVNTKSASTGPRKSGGICCHKCKETTDPKKSALCSVCNRTYHFECDGYPEKVYRLKETQNREKWQCKACLRKLNSSLQSKQISNVTHRKPIKTSTKAKEQAPETPNIITEETQLVCAEICPETMIPNRSNQKRLEIAQHYNADLLASIMNEAMTPTNVLTLPVSQQAEEEHWEQGNTVLSSESLLLNESVLSSCSTVSNEKRSKSLDYSTNDMITTLEMKAEINRLSMELVSTQNQFEEVSIENNRQKRTIDKLYREILTLKKLCKSSNCKEWDKKRRHSIHNDKQLAVTPLRFSSTPSSRGGCKINGCSDSGCAAEILHLISQIESLTEEQKMYKEQISDLHAQVESLKQKLHVPDNTVIMDNGNNDKQMERTAALSKPKNKLMPLLQTKWCVISNYTNYMLKLLKNSFPSENTCHYLAPGGGTRELFRGIENKLRDFTFNDFCIVYIGDQDFKTSINYDSLVDYIQMQLSEVQHTNIIICLPTFKIGYYSNLFIKRVERFNNLLYKINLKYEFSYILDSNLNLTFDNVMFSRSGNVNRRGFQTIFSDLITLLTSIPNDYIANDFTQNNLNLRDFFRS